MYAPGTLSILISLLRPLNDMLSPKNCPAQAELHVADLADNALI
jgi:hypothetical protein